MVRLVEAPRALVQLAEAGAYPVRDGRSIEGMKRLVEDEKVWSIVVVAYA